MPNDKTLTTVEKLIEATGELLVEIHWGIDAKSKYAVLYEKMARAEQARLEAICLNQ